MQMTNLDKLLKEFKEARSAATPYEETHDSKCPECGLQTFGYRHWNGCNLLDKHKAYKDLAANKSDKLIKIIEVMRENLSEAQKQLEMFNFAKDEVRAYAASDAVLKALQQAEKIAGE